MSPPALVGQMHPMGWEQTQPHKHDTTPDVPADRTAMPWDASRSDAPPRSPGEPPRPGGRPVHAEEVDELDALLRAVYPLIRKYEEDNAYPDDTRVIEHRGGPELRSALDLSLPPEGSRAAYVRTCEEAIRYSVRTSHPRFMNQLYAGSEPAGQVAEFLAAVLNSTVHTYGAGPVFTVMERELIAQVATLVGFDADEADGVFAPGGSYSNMTALLVARNELFPHVSRQGWQEGDRPVVYTSVQAHYSVKKAVMIAGMGSDNLIEVPTDADGAMDPAWLESHIIASKDNARRPFFVSATAGTTVLGAIDPLPALHDICQRHGVWLHVDGAWGGALIMSDTHRHKLSGLEKADSFCFNPHKLLGVPLQCSMLLVNKHSGALERANNTDADYLFHAGAGGGVDLGQKSLQCGRKPDCLKLFLCWKRFGAKGFGARVDRAIAHAQSLATKVTGDERFVLLRDPATCNVCFYYLPPSLRAYRDEVMGAVPDAPGSDSQGGPAGNTGVLEPLGRVTQEVYRRMQLDGRMLVNFSPLPDLNLPHFFRAVFIQPRVTEEDLDFLLAEIDRLGADL